MKLAEALLERADLNSRIENMRTRLVNNARVQEGAEIGEKPTDLFKELNEYLARFEHLVVAINKTNELTKASNGKTLSELIAQKDALGKRLSILNRFYECASNVIQRATHTEIRILPTYDIKKLQREINDCSKEIRTVDTLLQESNWIADLIES